MREELRTLLLAAMPATVEDLAAECGYSLVGTRKLLQELRDARLCFMLRRQEDRRHVFVKGRGLDSRPKPADPSITRAKYYQKRKARAQHKAAQAKGPFSALFQ